MTFNNTADNYGSVARWLHWITAILFLAAYCAVYYRHWFTEEKTAENLAALHLHLSFGMSIAVVVALRLYWRISSRQPDPVPGTRLAHRAAHLGHMALYGIMVIAPVTGYIGTGVAVEYFFLFEIPKFADTWLFQVLVSDGLGMTFEEFEEPVDFVHKQVLGEWLVWMLILGHAGAAMVHHTIKRDRTLYRMTSGG